MRNQVDLLLRQEVPLMLGISLTELFEFVIPALIAGIGLVRACDHFIPEED